MRKHIITLAIAFVLFSPLFVSAAGIVPDCGKVVNGAIPQPCNFEYLIQLINRAITYLLFYLATPLAALAISYAGWLYLTSGGGEQTSKAKKILGNVVIGYIIALAAWLIVKVIVVDVLGFKGTTFLKS